MLRGACHRAALRADPLARNDVDGFGRTLTRVAACDKSTRRAKFRFTRNGNQCRTIVISSPRQGRWPSSRTLGWELRWTLRHRIDAPCCGVRQKRWVLTSRSWCQVCGHARRRRWQSDRREGNVISRKAIAQGMSDVLRCPVRSCAPSSLPLHTRPRVQRASGIPCSLISRGGQRNAKPRAKLRRENADVYLLLRNLKLKNEIRSSRTSEQRERRSGTPSVSALALIAAPRP